VPTESGALKNAYKKQVGETSSMAIHDLIPGQIVHYTEKKTKEKSAPSTRNMLFSMANRPKGASITNVTGPVTKLPIANHFRAPGNRF
jgi:hypothetical protein